MREQDHELLRRVARQEPAAVETFVRAHTDAVWRFALSNVGEVESREVVYRGVSP